MKEVCELPHFLLGQSMGGAVALKVHLKQQKEWDGVLLVAPMCKVILKLPIIIRLGQHAITSFCFC